MAVHLASHHIRRHHPVHMGPRKALLIPRSPDVRVKCYFVGAFSHRDPSVDYPGTYVRNKPPPYSAAALHIPNS